MVQRISMEGSCVGELARQFGGITKSALSTK
jgi:hypothetical protein